MESVIGRIPTQRIVTSSGADFTHCAIPSVRGGTFKNLRSKPLLHLQLNLVPVAGLEPARPFKGPLDFKSNASAISPHRRRGTTLEARRMPRKRQLRLVSGGGRGNRDRAPAEPLVLAGRPDAGRGVPARVVHGLGQPRAGGWRKTV